MPGWHKRTKTLEADGKLAVAGLVQEQHGDRAALFMQWKGMNWPVMVDSLNLLGVRAVPITYLIDEAGIIREVNPKGDTLQKFLATDFQPAKIEAPKFVPRDKATTLAIAAVNTASPTPAALDAAIKALSDSAEDAADFFRLGVLMRKRYDSPSRRTGDFAGAVTAWGKALAANPGQYIWRRRIQQYGPRLDKPYPFYDWVPRARQEIQAAGGEPVELIAQPSGAEIAAPSKTLDSKTAPAHPDPEGQLPLDTTTLIRIGQVVVPSTDKRRTGYRVHLQLTPDAKRGGHWNNEAGVSAVRIEAGDGWQVSPSHLPLVPTTPLVATSSESRAVEFELKPEPDAVDLGPIRASAFYYVCEGESAVCQYLRYDFEIELGR